MSELLENILEPVPVSYFDSSVKIKIALSLKTVLAVHSCLDVPSFKIIEEI